MVKNHYTSKGKTSMKKLIVTAALLATTGLAAAQATVYGRMNATVDSTKTGTVKTDSIVNDISHIGFRVQENLGHGLSARAVIETGITSQDPVAGTDTQLGNRQSTVGVAGRLGSVDIGRTVHGVFTTLADGDSFGALYGSIAGDVHDLRGLRLSNGVFASATVIPGVTVGMDRTHTAAGNEAVVYSASGKLAGVNVGVARFEQGAEKSTVASAGMRVGKAGVFYSYSDNSGAANSKGHLVGVSQKMGAVTVKAGYGQTDRDVKAYNVGAEYAFSKRTDLLVSYRNVDRVAAANDVKQIGVGITHRF
jgi:predicted porin